MTALAWPIEATTRPNLLRLSTEWLNASVVRITVAGDVDASNAAEFGHYVFRHAANSRRLILDLQGVEFFGTAGFSTLRLIDSRCDHAGIHWTLLCNRTVSRVLQICDPRRTLPISKV